MDKDNRFGSLQRSFRVTWRGGVIDYQESFIIVPALAPPGPTSIYTNQQLPAPVSNYTFRAPASLQPPPKYVKPLQPSDPPSSQPPDPPTPTGRTLTVNQYLGYEHGRRWETEEPKEETVQP